MKPENHSASQSQSQESGRRKLSARRTLVQKQASPPHKV